MAQDQTAQVFTIGYGDKTLAGFLDALEPYGIEIVVDIRAVPDSSVEGFSQDELADALSGASLQYAHLGELGDFQPEPYPDYMETETWEAAYQALLDLAEEGVCCLMAPNPDIGSCYRRFIQQRLEADGYTVVHLTPAGPRQATTLDQGR